MRLSRLLFALALSLTPVSAHADDVADIRARLDQWTDDFNAKRVDTVCDLFSREVKSDIRTQGETGYEERCVLLQKALKDTARTFHYEYAVKDILPLGEDIAVVRLTWTSFLMPLNVTSSEEGMDVFRKEADGQWRIVRYMSYEEE